MCSHCLSFFVLPLRTRASVLRPSGAFASLCLASESRACCCSPTQHSDVDAPFLGTERSTAPRRESNGQVPQHGTARKPLRGGPVLPCGSCDAKAVCSFFLFGRKMCQRRISVRDRRDHLQRGRDLVSQVFRASIGMARDLEDRKVQAVPNFRPCDSSQLIFYLLILSGCPRSFLKSVCRSPKKG